MLLLTVLLLTAEVLSLNSNLSSLRLGKVKLLEDLRASDILKYKLSPNGADKIVKVDFMYQHYQVLAVNEVEQAVTSIGYVAMRWNDSDLTWNKTDYGGIDVVSIPRDEIWRPTIIVSNSVDPDYLMIDRMETVSLSSDGTVIYLTPVFLQTTCDMNLKYFPFDTQTCLIFFVSYFGDVDPRFYAVNFTDLPNSLKVTGEWTLKSSSVTISSLTNLGGIQVISFTMTIKRRTIYYCLYVLSPMLLTSSMTSMVFWIPPGSGEKISFLVTLSVTSAVFLNFIAGTMTRSISDMPRLALFLIFVNLQCVVAMIQTMFVLRKYEQEQNNAMLIQKEASVEQPGGKISVQRQDTTTENEPETKSKNSSNFTFQPTSYGFRKWVFPKFRIAPLITFATDISHKTRNRICRCSLRSSTWDTIFFWTFHVISIPCYFFIFIV